MPFIIEIKRVEKLELSAWWKQVQKAEADIARFILDPLYPVVAYRQSRQPWKFLISTRHIGLENDNYMIINEESFILWVHQI